MTARLALCLAMALLALAPDANAQPVENPLDTLPPVTPEPARRMFDIGLAPGAGFFAYRQYVDGGYYIDGKPHDLVWYGPQLQLAADFHWYLSSHPTIGIGVASAFLFAPTVAATDFGDSASVHPGKGAIGGFWALAASYRPNERWRYSMWAGYGGAGLSDSSGFGGWGLSMGIAGHYLFSGNSLATGVGLRLGTMVLSTPGNGSTRGEWGVFSSVLAEFLFDYSKKR
jgi:hypothetical protein